MDENAVGSLPLTAVACHRIAVVEMGMLPNVERDRATRVEMDLEVAAGIDASQRWPAHGWRYVPPIRCGELYAVAFTECLIYLSIQRHAPKRRGS